MNMEFSALKNEINTDKVNKLHVGLDTLLSFKCFRINSLHESVHQIAGKE